MTPLLTIAIPTTPDREELFSKIWGELNNQAKGLSVEIIYDNTGKEMPIGTKRGILYNRASGKYCVHWDSDDWCHPEAVKLILHALEQNPDCVGYEEHCVIDNIEKKSNITIVYGDWDGEGHHPFSDEYHFHRTPSFKSPILTELCKRVGVTDSRWGEDHDFARRIKPYLANEVYIKEPIYHYIHNSSNYIERYGFDRES